MKLSMIKKTLILLAISLMAFVSDNPCSFYYPTGVGTITETTFYNNKGKPTGSVSYMEVVSETDSAGYKVEKIREWSSSADSDSSGIIEYKVMCKGDEFLMDMSNYMDQEKMQAYEGMDISISSSNISIPSNPTEGQSLDDGYVSAQISNEEIPIMTITVNIKNRKVEALEKITTPAGTFDAVKISYDLEMRMGLLFKYKGKQWFVKNNGIVRTELWNKKGSKMMSYDELTKITRK